MSALACTVSTTIQHLPRGPTGTNSVGVLAALSSQHRTMPGSKMMVVTWLRYRAMTSCCLLSHGTAGVRWGDDSTALTGYVSTHSRINPAFHLEVLPNRNSLPYLDLYGIPDATGCYRGTLRYDVRTVRCLLRG